MCIYNRQTPCRLDYWACRVSLFTNQLIESWFMRRGYHSHSIKRLVFDWVDILRVMCSVCFIGVENRGCFWFCRRSVAQLVNMKKPHWLLGIFSVIAVSVVLQLQRYAFSLIYTTPTSCNFSATSVALAMQPGSYIIGYLWHLKHWELGR